MKESEVNELIINKIKKSKIKESVKKFLIEILDWELGHSHEERPIFKPDYLKRVEKYFKK